MSAPSSAILEQIRLSPEATKTIDRAFETVDIAANQDLFLAGHHKVQELYFVEKGCLRLYSLAEDGSTHNLQFATEGHWITDLNAFQNESRALFGLASLEPCQLWRIQKASLEELYQKVPLLERYFRILIQNAYQQALIRTQMQLQGSAAKRYQYFLAKFPQLQKRIPQYHIASFIGIKAQSLSRLKSQNGD